MIAGTTITPAAGSYLLVCDIHLPTMVAALTVNPRSPHDLHLGHIVPPAERGPIAPQVRGPEEEPMGELDKVLVAGVIAVGLTGGASAFA